LQLLEQFGELHDFCQLDACQQLLSKDGDLLVQFRIETTAGVGHHNMPNPSVGNGGFALHKTRLNQTIDHVHHGCARDREHVGKFGLRQW
jgi:hypothetical protein